jgi:heavy metal sensor kinase
MGGGGPQVTDWWSSIPQDALRRIGENEQDQPYFAIWGYDIRGWRVYRSSSNAESAGVPTKEDLSAPAPAQWGMSTSEEGAKPEFRTRGEMREVIVKSPGGGMHVVVGKSLASVYKDVAAIRKDMLILKWKLVGAGGAVMAIGLIGGWLLSLRATKPIRAISATAQAISASDLSKRIPVEETSSELGVLAGTLNEMFGRLQEAFDRQVRFTADASHELRTPLSVIHSQAELSLSRERNAGEYKQSLEVCLRAAKRMKSLVESLLVLARADAGKLVLNVEKFDLAKAAEECVALVGPRAAEKHVTVETDLKTVEMEADRTKVMQLITNLLANAMQYNKEGGKVCLKTGAVTGSGWGDGQAEIRVADTGVGISNEDQKKVFERFFRTDKARSRDVGGSGLGLAICQSIAEAHGGRITFTSKEGEGTEFVVRMATTREKDGAELTKEK